MSAMRYPRLFATGFAAALAACAASRAPSSALSVAATPKAAPPEPSLTPARGAVDETPTPAALADARHLLNRCAFGPRPGEVERVARLGPQRWLEQQLAGPAESPLLEAALIPHRSAYAPPAELVDEWLGDGWENETRTLKELRQEAKPHYREHLQRLATAELTRHILSQRQLEAVMTDFWANHFNVYASKGFVRLYEGDYLERAIRPHALGRFSELLLATARHPAMLLYLDNADSRRESPAAMAGARARRRGLNENYARELLELHTLGVDGGYTQTDVQQVARILTGWSVVRMTGGHFEYEFKRGVHDRHSKLVLGTEFPKGGQEEEGVRLLEMLARHPATARNISRQLCQRFVADSPPPSCVSAATSAFTSSDGDIKAVLRAIVSDVGFWSPEARGSKLKTPLELVASAARALEAVPDGSLALSRSLERLGEPLLEERVPTGYPESEPAWASSGGMLARMTFAAELGEGKVLGLTIPWDQTLPPSDSGPELVTRLGARLLGAAPDSRALSIVRDELVSLSDPEQRRAAAVALLVGSPEFQRQ
jgi:hypothetical protein